jgi:hypothetical protein
VDGGNEGRRRRDDLYEASRHSFRVTNMAAGVPLVELSAAIGHSSPVVTMRFYARYLWKPFSEAIRGFGRKGRRQLPTVEVPGSWRGNSTQRLRDRWRGR